MGLPAVKEFGEPSTQLEFDEFDDVAVDEGKPETKGSDRPPAGGANERDESSGEGEVSESQPKKKTKPPTVDEYQWQWKVSLVHNCNCSMLTRLHSLNLKPPDVHFSCSLCSLSKADGLSSGNSSH